MKMFTNRCLNAEKAIKTAIAVCLSAAAIFFVFGLTVTVHANSASGTNNASNPHTTHGFGEPSRPAPVNINDHHTSAWDRFHHNYHFTSNIDFRHIFGRPTYASASLLQPNPSTQNIRRDRNVANAPLPYGVFSATIDTYRTNPFFATWVNEQGGLPFVLDNPNALAQFDILLLGANSRDWLKPNPLNMFDVGRGQEPMLLNTSQMLPPEMQGSNAGFLPPTSLGR